MATWTETHPDGNKLTGWQVDYKKCVGVNLMELLSHCCVVVFLTVKTVLSLSPGQDEHTSHSLTD